MEKLSFAESEPVFHELVIPAAGCDDFGEREILDAFGPYLERYYPSRR